MAEQDHGDPTIAQLVERITRWGESKGWDKPALCATRGRVLTEGEKEALRAIQRGARRLESSGIKRVKLVGEGWDRERRYAFAQGFYAAKGVRELDFGEQSALEARELEALLLADIHNHGHAAEQANHLIIADPVRGRNNDLIAVIEGGGQCIEDHLLTTAADLCVLPTDRQTILDPVLVRNGLAQGTQTGHWGIARVACVDSRDGRLADVLRSIEIRLARTQGKNTVTLIAALGDPVHDAVSG